MNIRIPNSFEALPNGVQDRAARVSAAVRSGSLLGSGLFWVGLVVFAAIAALIALSLFGGSAPHESPPPPVIVQRAVPNDFQVAERTIGTVVSPATVQITSRVEGQIVKAFFAEGQSVHKGDLLFQIDPGPYQAALNNAQATLGTAQAKWARYQRLLSQNAVAGQDADDAKAAYLSAKANVDAARLNLQYTQIRSPIDGKTGPILIQPGNQVTATGGGALPVGTNPMTGSTLVVITQMHPIKISFSLPQADLPRIQKRLAGGAMPVTLQAQGGGDAVQANVDFVGNEVSGQTGTVELRATFANDKSTLVPGQLVDVSAVLETLHHVMTVPHDAINLGPSENYVYVVKNHIATMVPVKVVADDGANAVINGKVKAGDAVIVDGQVKVVAGKPVSVAHPPKK